jgi:hypothetical protein
MEIDWDSDESRARWSWPLVRRVLGHFRPYWLHGLAAVVCLAVGAGLGLAVGGLYAELYRRQFLDQEPAQAGVS